MIGLDTETRLTFTFFSSAFVISVLINKELKHKSSIYKLAMFTLNKELSEMKSLNLYPVHVQPG